MDRDTKQIVERIEAAIDENNWYGAAHVIATEIALRSDLADECERIERVHDAAGWLTADINATRNILAGKLNRALTTAGIRRYL